MKTIDLRSDTVTQPTHAMRDAMAVAEVGDDVYGEDPSINRLEALAAEIMGTEAAIFATSGTQSNLLALMSHCGRGDEYIVGQLAHTYRYEGGGAAILGSIQPQPLDLEKDGTLALDKVAQFIKPKDFHFARTRLLCLENTQAGKILPLDYLKEASVFAKKHQLGLHLDGARVFNAAAGLDVPVDAISRHFDSISVCLSKGLGAPVGSVLCGTRKLIDKARRWRKLLGGGMRQAGVLAVAGIIALTDHVKRLKEDHENAALLAKGLNRIDEIDIDFNNVQTNMVFITVPDSCSTALVDFLRQRAIRINGARTFRLVTHLDVDQNDIKQVIASFEAFFVEYTDR